MSKIFLLNWAPEALEDLDKDGDGMVDLQEFLAVHEARF